MFPAILACPDGLALTYTLPSKVSKLKPNGPDFDRTATIGRANVHRSGRIEVDNNAVHICRFIRSTFSSLIPIHRSPFCTCFCKTIEFVAATTESKHTRPDAVCPKDNGKVRSFITTSIEVS